MAPENVSLNGAFMTSGCSGSLVLGPLKPWGFNRVTEARALPQSEVRPAVRRKSLRGERRSDRGFGQEQLSTDGGVVVVDGYSSVQSGVLVLVDLLNWKLDPAWNKEEAGYLILVPIAILWLICCCRCSSVGSVVQEPIS